MPGPRAHSDKNDDESRNNSGRARSTRRNIRPRSAEYTSLNLEEQRASSLSIDLDHARPHSARLAGDVLHARDPRRTPTTPSMMQPRTSTAATPKPDERDARYRAGVIPPTTASSTGIKKIVLVGIKQDLTATEADGRTQGPILPGLLFDVTFKPTGPLGITFEWAPDLTAWSTAANASFPLSSEHVHAPTERVGGTSDEDPLLPLLGASTSRSELFGAGTNVSRISADGNSAEQLPAVESPTVVLGGTQARSPPPLLPSSLPPLPSSASNTSSSDDFDPPVLHALRIHSFPLLPRKSTSSKSPAALTPAPSRGVTKARPSYINLVCDDVFKDARDFGHLYQQQHRSSGSHTYANIRRENSILKGENGTRTGPVEGRGVLRPGDILVFVNGVPVAGPDARRAGVNTFDDAVKAVAEAAPAGGEKPRVLTFKRGVQRPASLSPPIAYPLEIAHSESSGDDAATRSGSPRGSGAGMADAEVSDTPSDSARFDDGQIRSSASRKGSTSVRNSEDREGEVMGGTLLSITSARSVSSMGSARAESRGGIELGRRLPGGRKGKGGSRVRGFRDGGTSDASSTVARIKEEARCLCRSLT